MQNSKLYEYAVIRIVPRVEREEFVNAGIILFCKKTKNLQCRIEVPEQKLLCLDPEADIELIHKNLQAFSDVANGHKNSGPIAALDVPERFRWLTATRSTIIQCGKVHPGISACEDEAADRLFKQFVTG